MAETVDLLVVGELLCHQTGNLLMFLQLRTTVLVGGQAASPLLFAHFWMKEEAKTEKSPSRPSCYTPKSPLPIERS